MEKRLIIAIVLSVCVMMVFQKYVEPKKAVVSSPAVSIAKPTEITQSSRATLGGEKLTATANDIPPEEIFSVETDRFSMEFTNKGGELKNIMLKEFKVTLASIEKWQSGVFELVLAGDVGDRTPFTAEKQGRAIKFYKEYKSMGLAVEKTYYAEEGKDVLNFDLTIYNLKNEPISVGYTLVGARGITNDPSSRGVNEKTDNSRIYIEADAEINGKTVRKNKIAGSKEYFSGIISWVALKNRYFAMALKTQKDCEGAFIAKDVDQKLFVGVESGKKEIKAGEALTQRYQLYMGPIQKARIAKLNMGMDGLVNYGFFGIISLFLLNVLTLVHGVVHNWGISIIIVTIGLNIVLYPLTIKSFASMKQMQELQPHLEKLRELHKDNPQKLNKEMMELYKQYNLNPFGGCLPMLLQMPIFVAFYQTLMKAIELKGATFLWIKDLSAPDAFIVFPQAYPLIGDKLNILPIITLAVMIIQQKTSMASNSKGQTPEMRQQQKMMGIMFPILFIVMLYNFSSGLILYWLTNSLAMTTEQYMFFHKRPKAA